jgi:hypothetical protein
VELGIENLEAGVRKVMGKSPSERQKSTASAKSDRVWVRHDVSLLGASTLSHKMASATHVLYRVT